MFRRQKFVTNSSSTNFIAWGIILQEKEIRNLNEDEELYPDGIYEIDEDRSNNVSIAQPNEEEVVLYIYESLEGGPEQGAEYITVSEVKPNWEKEIKEALAKYKIDTDETPGWLLCAYHDW
jgi:hypothetical protein